MRLTSFTDYGLRMLMRMASEPQRAFSSGELADEFNLSRNHLTKIMQRLAQGQIVRTQRGAGGGARLAVKPRELKLGRIVQLLEQDQPLVECLSADRGNCTIDGQCRVKARLRSAEAAFLRDLDKATLADIALPTRAPA
ncbi:RrF2 family transcriptional regulator [Hyphomonas johnsonii]|jgi:Rrf2 family nitric oxide-sensitive transcriptional repressor|uniref:Putative transcriptional regulator n=1 Tax=Hyphomonas johnsonii MHS-2 TaxID=1280950 RepID=A0A059FRW9_9PROT|nr:Rrf2 family transcriptional regulator [Hyphomonas johnsonii]KCZ93415.1 putative transcriptional regulator [Hyphomonas johnsonii MHS-2]